MLFGKVRIADEVGQFAHILAHRQLSRRMDIVDIGRHELERDATRIHRAAKGNDCKAAAGKTGTVRTERGKLVLFVISVGVAEGAANLQPIERADRCFCLDTLDGSGGWQDLRAACKGGEIEVGTRALDIFIIGIEIGDVQTAWNRAHAPVGLETCFVAGELFGIERAKLCVDGSRVEAPGFISSRHLAIDHQTTDRLVIKPDSPGRRLRLECCTIGAQVSGSLGRVVERTANGAVS